jgi:hypothetical protein
MWMKYSVRVEGIRLAGDPEVPPTTWWNHLFLLLFVWNRVSVLQVPFGVEEYRVGYIDHRGRVMYNTTHITSRFFAVRHGYEPCRFFAITNDGTELPLTLQARTTLEELLPGIPLV